MNGPQYGYFQDGPRRRPRHSPLPSTPSRLASVSGVLGRNKDLLRNAGSLAGTTGITSFLGFAYWVYAARVFSTDAVGHGSAAISTMILFGTIGMFGFDTMLIGELPRERNRGGLIMACCIGAFVVSLALGLGFALVSLAFGGHFVQINGTVGRMAIFSVGVAITGATAVFDAATIGLMRGGLQLSRNVAMSIAKMAALPAFALLLKDVFGVGIIVAWVIGTVISLLPVAIMIKRGGGRILYRPDWATFWRLRNLAVAHNWLNLAIAIPTKLIPVLVAIVVSPSSNGAYYIANMMFSFLMMVPTSLSTVLFAVASAAPEKVAEKLRFVLRTSLIVGIIGGLAMGVSSHLTLSVFGANYAKLAVGPLWILIIGYLPGLPNAVYIAVSRVQGRFNQASIFLTAFAVLRMGALVVGGKLGGLYGLSYGMLAVQVVQALITTPAVLRVAFGSVTVRSAADAIDADEARALAAEEMRVQQEAGIAALIALATRVAPSQRLSDTGTLAVGLRAVADSGQRRSLATGPVKRGNPAITETNWWPDLNEAAFRSRQEFGMAALIQIATHAANF